ncbi:MAG: COX15/CtaA family protein [Bdellovibrio sp.]|jgi:cytochrome c oxidase assembly protein subunit 15
MKKALWITLFYTLLVIVWGAWVRISHSGDGCGASWPFCHGVVIPMGHGKKTWIEFTHRLMSGAYGILILGLTLQMLRKTTQASAKAQLWMKLTLLFTITEALLGAKLVLFGLVGSNDTPHRAFVMSLHFLNSLFLTGSLTLTVLYFENKNLLTRDLNKIKGLSERLLKRIPPWSMGLFLLIGMTGTIAALSNTLYPADSLIQGLMQDLDSSSHYLVRLRGLHPTLGLLIGIGMTVFFYLISEYLEQSEAVLKKRSFALSLAFATVVILGTLTILTGAVVALKLTHLLAAHGLWITLLMFWHALRYRIH